MITIERKEYNENGTEYILNIPVSTKIDYWKGSINSNTYNIEDAYNIESINITDNYSTGILSLLEKILKTKQQERLIPTDIKLIKSFSGPECLPNNSVNFDINLIDEPIEINLQNLQINGIPVLKGYKCSGNVSFYSPPEMTVLMDNRKSMINYKNLEATNVVYTTLSKSIICKENGELTDWAKQLLPEDANPENYYEEIDEWGITSNNEGNMYDELGEPYIKISNFGRLYYNKKLKNRLAYGIIAIAPKLDVSKFCILMGIKIGKEGMLPDWIREAYENYGLDTNVLNSRYKQFPDIQYAFTNEKTQILKSTGTQYILFNRTWNNSGRRVTAQTKISVTASAQKFIFGSGTWDGSTILLHSNTDARYSWYNGAPSAQGILHDGFNVMKEINLQMIGTSTSANGDAQLRLFGGCSGSTYNGSILCSYFRYYENGVLTRFYVPFCEDGEYGMLDLVENKFYKNSGTGSFIYELI